MIKKSFETLRLKPRIFNILEITRIFYSNSDRSDQFRNKNTIFNLLLKVSTFKYIGTIKVSFGKKIGHRNLPE